MNIYELTGQLLELQNMLEGGEYDEETMRDTIESVEMVFEDKAEGYAKIIQNLNAHVAGLDAEIERLDTRRSTIANNVKRLKETLHSAMVATGKTKFKTKLFSFGIQATPAKVVIDDEAKIPAKYLIGQAPKIDKKGIGEALKSGEKLECAHLEQGETLRIR